MGDVENINGDQKILVKNLGMSVAETWRGIPDCRLRGISLESDVPLLSGSTQPQEDRSNGTTAVCEAKLKIDQRKNLIQVVKTCVVSSFIEANLHPGLNTMVPTILIDTEKAMVVLYCAKSDLLLVSKTFYWRENDKFNVAGITFLWAMINHRYDKAIFLTLCTLNISDRYFLKVVLSKIETADKSGIHTHLEGMNALDRFKELATKNLEFKRKSARGQSDDGEDEDLVHVVYHIGPPPRKRPHNA